MTLRLSTLVLLSLALGAAGCGGSSLSANKACTDEVTARCALFMSCSNGALITTRYGDLPTCEARELSACLERLMAAGTTATPTFEEACAVAEPTESCPDFLDGNPTAACIAPLGGMANNAPCIANGQCTSGYCNLGAHSVCGTCGPAATAGTSCANASCAHGLVCLASTSLCVALGAMGAACDVNTPCQSDMSCVGSNTKKMTMGTCQPAVATVGGACNPAAQTLANCDRTKGLTCDPTAKTCVAINYVAAGQPCRSAEPGVIIGCAAGGGCYPVGGTMQTCLAAAAEGATCDTVAGPGCLQPAKCVPPGTATAGTCQLPNPTVCK